jgi:pimeloyl-ACP methyl ester carboxylesterase
VADIVVANKKRKYADGQAPSLTLMPRAAHVPAVLPETRYARSGGLSIAYQVMGDGPRDLILVPGIVSHVEFFHELPNYTDLLRGLAAFSRVIVFDKRGNGLSDRIVGAPSLEDRMDDVRAVMEATGSERATLLGVSEGGPISLLFAATYPERVDALVLYETFVRFGGTADYPVGTPADMHSALSAVIPEVWGTGATLRLMAMSRSEDAELLALWARAERLSGSPGDMCALFKMLGEIDVRAALPSVRAPCLVLHGTANSMFTEASHYLAAHLADARVVALEGAEHYPWFGRTEAIIAEVEEFLTGTRSAPGGDRQLATTLFTDIVGSTVRAAELGDRRWHELLTKHHALVRRHLERFRGRLVDTAGDGVLALFDGPARAVRCACAIRDGVRGLGLEIRAGLHAGEIERRGDDVAGMALHIGARVAALAEPGEVLVSRTVKDLVVGSGLEFAERGTHELKGVPETWQLYAVRGTGDTG